MTAEFERALEESARATPDEQRALIARYIRSVLAAPSSERDWLRDLDDLVDNADLPATDLRALCAELAWVCREERIATPPDPVAAPQTTVTREYIFLQRLRYDFRFEPLVEAARTLRAQRPHDPMVWSFYVFGLLALRRPNALSMYDELLAEPELDRACRFVLLQGLWLAGEGNDYVERLLALSERLIIRGEDPPNVYYWRSAGLRRADRFDEAYTAIDEALNRLDPTSIAVHADYVREREIVATSASLKRVMDAGIAQAQRQLESSTNDALEVAQAEFETRSRRADELVTQSLSGIVEVLGLFVALIAFLAGSGYLVVKSGSFARELAGVGLLLVGSIAFFVLLRFVVRLGRH